MQKLLVLTAVLVSGCGVGRLYRFAIGLMDHTQIGPSTIALRF